MTKEEEKERRKEGRKKGREEGPVLAPVCNEKSKEQKQPAVACPLEVRARINNGEAVGILIKCLLCRRNARTTDPDRLVIVFFFPFFSFLFGPLLLLEKEQMCPQGHGDRRKHRKKKEEKKMRVLWMLCCFCPFLLYPFKSKWRKGMDGVLLAFGPDQ